ncbi:MAG TPA: carboxypeptidase-like regulatory domain-containing protein [Acidisarcina sp.]
MKSLTLSAVLLFVAVGISHAQAPLPAPVAVGEASSATSLLKGTAQTTTGKRLRSVQLTIKSEDGESTFTTQTNEEGRFGVQLPAGSYTVAAEAVGFVETKRNISVLPDHGSTIKLVMRGPVPDAEPTLISAGAIPTHETQSTHSEAANVPLLPTGTSAITAQFQSWTDLANWLNTQSARNLRLQAILNIADFKNVFVWVAHGTVDQHIVVPANTINGPTTLQAILKVYPQATVIGLAWVNHDRYLVLRSGS